MIAKLEYDPSKFSEKANFLVMFKAEQWKCAPSEALRRMLDEMADSELVQTPVRSVRAAAGFPKLSPQPA